MAASRNLPKRDDACDSRRAASDLLMNGHAMNGSVGSTAHHFSMMIVVPSEKMR